MQYIPQHPYFTATVAAAQQHGAGPLLRIVLVVMLVGTALTGWFLLRGYRDNGPGVSGGEAATGTLATGAARAQGVAPGDVPTDPDPDGTGRAGVGAEHAARSGEDS